MAVSTTALERAKRFLAADADASELIEPAPSSESKVALSRAHEQVETGFTSARPGSRGITVSSNTLRLVRSRFQDDDTAKDAANASTDIAATVQDANECTAEEVPVDRTGATEDAATAKMHANEPNLSAGGFTSGRGTQVKVSSAALARARARLAAIDAEAPMSSSSPALPTAAALDDSARKVSSAFENAAPLPTMPVMDSDLGVSFTSGRGTKLVVSTSALSRARAQLAAADAEAPLANAQEATVVSGAIPSLSPTHPLNLSLPPLPSPPPQSCQVQVNTQILAPLATNALTRGVGFSPRPLGGGVARRQPARASPRSAVPASLSGCRPASASAPSADGRRVRRRSSAGGAGSPTPSVASRVFDDGPPSSAVHPLHEKLVRGLPAATAAGGLLQFQTSAGVVDTADAAQVPPRRLSVLEAMRRGYVAPCAGRGGQPPENRASSAAASVYDVTAADINYHNAHRVCFSPVTGRPLLQPQFGAPPPMGALDAAAARRELLSRGCSARQATEVWVANHARLITAKLARLEAQGEELDAARRTAGAGTAATVAPFYAHLHWDRLIAQLLCRYQREKIGAARSALRRVLEGDCAADAYFVLTVARILRPVGDCDCVGDAGGGGCSGRCGSGSCSGATPAPLTNALLAQCPGSAVLELTDGWYTLGALAADVHMAGLFENRGAGARLREGLKLRVCGAQLLRTTGDAALLYPKLAVGAVGGGNSGASGGIAAAHRSRGALEFVNRSTGGAASLFVTADATDPLETAWALPLPTGYEPLGTALAAPSSEQKTPASQLPRFLTLHYNCVKPAPWHAKLGLQPAVAFVTPLRSLRPAGGPVPLVEVVLARRHAARYLASLPDGSRAVLGPEEAQATAEEAAAQCSRALEAALGCAQRRHEDAVAAISRRARGGGVAVATTQAGSDQDYATVADAERAYVSEVEALRTQFHEAMRGFDGSSGAGAAGGGDTAIPRASRLVPMFSCTVLDTEPLRRLRVNATAAAASAAAVPVFAGPQAAELTLWRVPEAAQDEYEEGGVYRIHGLETADGESAAIFETTGAAGVGTAESAASAAAAPVFGAMCPVRLSTAKATLWKRVTPRVSDSDFAVAILPVAVRKSAEGTSVIVTHDSWRDSAAVAGAAGLFSPTPPSPEPQMLAPPHSPNMSLAPSQPLQNVAVASLSKAAPPQLALLLAAAGYLPRSRCLFAHAPAAAAAARQVVLRAQLGLLRAASGELRLTLPCSALPALAAAADSCSAPNNNVDALAVVLATSAPQPAALTFARLTSSATPAAAAAAASASASAAGGRRPADDDVCWTIALLDEAGTPAIVHVVGSVGARCALTGEKPSAMRNALAAQLVLARGSGAQLPHAPLRPSTPASVVDAGAVSGGGILSAGNLVSLSDLRFIGFGPLLGPRLGTAGACSATSSSSVVAPVAHFTLTDGSRVLCHGTRLLPGLAAAPPAWLCAPPAAPWRAASVDEASPLLSALAPPLLPGLPVRVVARCVAGARAAAPDASSGSSGGSGAPWARWAAPQLQAWLSDGLSLRAVAPVESPPAKRRRRRGASTAAMEAAAGASSNSASGAAVGAGADADAYLLSQTPASQLGSQAAAASSQSACQQPSGASPMSPSLPPPPSVAALAVHPIPLALASPALGALVGGAALPGVALRVAAAGARHARVLRTPACAHSSSTGDAAPTVPAALPAGGCTGSGRAAARLTLKRLRFSLISPARGAAAAAVATTDCEGGDAELGLPMPTSKGRTPARAFNTPRMQAPAAAGAESTTVGPVPARAAVPCSTSAAPPAVDSANSRLVAAVIFVASPGTSLTAVGATTEPGAALATRWQARLAGAPEAAAQTAVPLATLAMPALR